MGSEKGLNNAKAFFIVLTGTLTHLLLSPPCNPAYMTCTLYILTCLSLIYRTYIPTGVLALVETSVWLATTTSRVQADMVVLQGAAACSTRLYI